MNKSDDLDLHGFTATNAVERFVQEYNLRVKRGQFGRWQIIHGYGSTGEGGSIRGKLRAFLAKHPDKLRIELGDSYGNPGWTWVYPKLPLPDQRERLALEILEYCQPGKTEEKILREFVGTPGLQVRELIRSLVQQGRLREVRQGSKHQFLPT